MSDEIEKMRSDIEKAHADLAAAAQRLMGIMSPRILQEAAVQVSAAAQRVVEARMYVPLLEQWVAVNGQPRAIDLPGVQRMLDLLTVEEQPTDLHEASAPAGSDEGASDALPHRDDELGAEQATCEGPKRLNADTMVFMRQAPITLREADKHSMLALIFEALLGHIDALEAEIATGTVKP